MTNITLLQIHKEFEGNISWADKLGRISMPTVQVVEVGPFSLKAIIWSFNQPLIIKSVSFIHVNKTKVFRSI